MSDTTAHKQRAAGFPVMGTIGEAADLLNISKGLAYKMAANGSLPVWRANASGKALRVNLDALREKIEAETSGAASAA
jgi:excisionase family DNA binding protein